LTKEYHFPNSSNNVVFADVKKGHYQSVHAQSFKISPDVNEIDENIDAMNQQKSQVLFRRISKAFKQQQQQAEIF
jgi:hypothetical protein